MISVQDRSDSSGRFSETIIKKKIRNYYKAKIPDDVIVESFENKTLGYTAVRDFAFLKDKLPRFTIDVVDTFVSMTTAPYRLFLHEINEMRREFSKVEPFIFTSKDSRERDNYERDANIIKKLGISIVEPDRHEEVMDEIKASVC